jgi:phosphoribosylanthranilate isomerase
VLLDARLPGKPGGTGRRCDWDLAARVAARRPVWLAGGLTPENVAEAIGRVGPHGVDVASGVEAAPGRQDPERVRAFVRAAKAAS